jgi:hypothetical protein
VRTKLRPSTAWYWVAGTIGVLGAIAASVIIVSAVTTTLDRIDDFHRVAVPGSRVVTLDDIGGYTLYYEEPGIGAGFVPPLRVGVIDVATGDELPLRSYGAEANYAFGGHEGVAVFTFGVDHPGEYEIVADGGGSGFGEVAVGRGVFTGLFAPVAGGIVAAIVAVLTTAVIAIVTGVRRHDDRRRQQWGPTGRPPPPGYGPPPGYRPPPG